MKKMIFLVALAMAGSALAQEEAPKPAVQEAVKAIQDAVKAVQEAVKAKPKAAKKSATMPRKSALMAKKSRRWHEDARHCLELGNNIEIIKCAEVYL
jgi:hypothetical protein